MFGVGTGGAAACPPAVSSSRTVADQESVRFAVPNVGAWTHETPTRYRLLVSLHAPDGSLTVQPYDVAVDPPIDCFYAYPTSSDDPTVSSDLVVGREAAVARVQVGAFNQVCDVYAPLYRSVTLAGLFALAWLLGPRYGVLAALFRRHQAPGPLFRR